MDADPAIRNVATAKTPRVGLVGANNAFPGDGGERGVARHLRAWRCEVPLRLN